jgi:hypothetical protein
MDCGIVTQVLNQALSEDSCVFGTIYARRKKSWLQALFQN